MTSAAAKMASYTTDQKQFVKKKSVLWMQRNYWQRLNTLTDMHTNLQYQMPGQHGVVRDIYNLQVCTQAIIQT